MPVRLRLRQFTLEDVGCLTELCRDTQVAQCVTATAGPCAPEQVRRYILSAMHDVALGRDHVFAVERLDDGRLMGEVRLAMGDSTLSYWLGAQFRGRRYMAEAVGSLQDYAQEELKMPMLIADVVRENLASRRVLERAGFRFQFIHRDELQPVSRHVTLLRYRHVFDCPPATGHAPAGQDMG